MDGKKVLGGILILIGIISAFYGVSELNSVSSKLMRLVGQTNTGAYMAIAGGFVAGILGLVLMFKTQQTT
jgi:hypothetical protein